MVSVYAVRVFVRMTDKSMHLFMCICMYLYVCACRAWENIRREKFCQVIHN